MEYQDNLLSELNAKDGHKVIIVSDCMRYESGKLVPVPSEDRILQNGVRLVRLPYDHIVTRYLSGKLRKSRHLRPLLDELAPDVILFHSCTGWELRTVSEYRKKNPHVKLYVDSHEDHLNSATNWLSKNILHKVIYRCFFQSAKDQIEKVLCTSPLRLQFVRDVYKVPTELLELYRMGGTILPDNEHEKIRRELRNTFGIADRQVFLLHAGKFDKSKKTVDLLEAFRSFPGLSVRLILAGAVANEIETEFYTVLEADNRVKYLGWMKGSELEQLYCAADIYIQPGLHSVNVESAICRGCALIVSPEANQMETVSIENGWIIGSIKELPEMLSEIINDKSVLDRKKKCSLEYAKENLDYVKLARRYIPIDCSAGNSVKCGNGT